MKLSQLVTGQEAIIKGVYGEGSIRKRMNEMGFVAGRKVKAIKAAPFKDPVEYDLMGYNITIRQKDASMIEIEKVLEPVSDQRIHGYENWSVGGRAHFSSKNNNNDSKTINVALVGNPNCGKTTIFNFATNSRERVANYSGVTVAAKEAKFEIGEYTINVIDLPGTYSLSSYSPEEMFVTDYLLNEHPDLVINVIDAGNLERNLYLTTQLIDSGVKTIISLNMYDELKANKGEIDVSKLSELLGMPVIPTIGVKGKGLKELFNTVIQVYHNSEKYIRTIDVHYGKEIEDAIDLISGDLMAEKNINDDSVRILALKILEGDRLFSNRISEQKVVELNQLASKQRINIEQICGTDIHTELVNLRYGFIQGALSETYTRGENEKLKLSAKIDRLLTHKYLGLPAFFVIVWFVFFATFKLGEYPMNGIDGLIGFISQGLTSLLPEGVITNLLVDGIIGGVGGVIIFLPNIIILFFLISVLEDSGYMARTAFIMDKAMHKVGLHGKSFIPLLMGFGCNVPAVMATRTIESKRDRMVTMFIIPFMSCSARLPVYVLFISAFFPHFQSTIMFSMYGIGILAALITALILNKTVFRKIESPFVMELPPYRFPTLKAVSKHTWFKTTHFLKKMGTVILLASIVVWALGYFPQNKEIISKYDARIEAEYSGVSGLESDVSMDVNQKINELETLKQSELLEQSYISRIGKFIEPVFEPLGFDWKMSVSILTGVMAKEVVVSSMGILYQAGTDIDESGSTLVNKLRNSQKEGGVPLIAYFGFLVFTLLYFPCLGTLIAIKKESKTSWMFFSAIYPVLFAWSVTFVIYQVGILF